MYCTLRPFITEELSERPHAPGAPLRPGATLAKDTIYLCMPSLAKKRSAELSSGGDTRSRSNQTHCSVLLDSIKDLVGGDADTCVLYQTKAREGEGLPSSGRTIRQ